ncbi:MAG: DUF1702 family protein [Planctomycetota bacterium]
MRAVTIAVPVALLAIPLLATGWWRWAFLPLRIRSARMNIEQLGLTVGPADRERVQGILSSFAGGFNAMISRPTWSGWQRYCAGLPVFYRPFAHEGAAMGYTPRRLFRYRPEEFEAWVVRPRPEMRYLYYVGLGFWSAMRHHDPRRLANIIEGLDPLHGYLCYDGYGFKHGFFDYLKNPGIVRRFEVLEGYARNVAYQGLGRAFWFLFMGDHDVLLERMGALGGYARDAAGGLGLAAVFVNPDQLEVALELGKELPAEWHEDFHVGMCFGLKARSINDVEQFERDMGRLDPQVREAVFASVRECDRIELQVRAERGPDAYRNWRRRVAQWMAGHIVFPLAGLKSASEPLRRDVGRSPTYLN